MFNDNGPTVPPTLKPATPAQNTPAPKPPTLPPAPPIKPATKPLGIILPIVMLIVGLIVAGAITYFWQTGVKNNALTELQTKLDLEKADLKTATDLLQKTLDNKDLELTALKTSGELPNIRITADPNTKTVNINNNEETVKELPLEENATLSILKQTANYIFFDEEYPASLLFNDYNDQTLHLYRYDLRNKNFEKITLPHTEAIVDDISDDGRLAVYRRDDKVYMYNLESKDLKDFSLPKEYADTFGDLTLSPNGQKIALAGVVIKPSGEAQYTAKSGVFIIDTVNNIVKKIVEKDRLTYHIKGWGSNEDASLSYYYFKP